MKEIHVLDESETDALSAGECESLECTEAIVAFEVLNHSSSQGEKHASEYDPEEDWSSAPKVDEWYPEDSTYTAILV